LDAHIKSATFGCDQLVIVEGGDIQLGTWRKSYFCDLGGPRARKQWVKPPLWVKAVRPYGSASLESLKLKL
jgi:hypothetical protein